MHLNINKTVKTQIKILIKQKKSDMVIYRLAGSNHLRKFLLSESHDNEFFYSSLFLTCLTSLRILSAACLRLQLRCKKKAKQLITFYSRNKSGCRELDKFCRRFDQANTVIQQASQQSPQWSDLVTDNCRQLQRHLAAATAKVLNNNYDFIKSLVSL